MFYDTGKLLRPINKNNRTDYLQFSASWILWTWIVCREIGAEWAFCLKSYWARQIRMIGGKERKSYLIHPYLEGTSLQQGERFIVADSKESTCHSFHWIETLGSNALIHPICPFYRSCAICTHCLPFPLGSKLHTITLWLIPLKWLWKQSSLTMAHTLLKHPFCLWTATNWCEWIVTLVKYVEYLILFNVREIMCIFIFPSLKCR